LSEEIVSLEQSNPLQSARPKSHYKSITIVIASGFLICMLSIGFLSWMVLSLKSQQNSLDLQLKEIKENASEEFVSVDGRINDLSSKVENVGTIDEKIKSLTKLSATLYLSHESEDAIVTDDFVLDKLYFRDLENLKMTIDLENQPDMNIHYTGKGAYDLTDRELRAKISNFIDEVKGYYTALNSSGTLSAWNENVEIILTVKNYELAKIINGEVILAGEK